MFLIPDVKRFLSFRRDLAIEEFQTQRFLVYRFQEPIPQLVIDFKRRAHHCIGFFFEEEIGHPSLWALKLFVSFVPGHLRVLRTCSSGHFTWRNEGSEPRIG
jgi:hypothetical protein